MASILKVDDLRGNTAAGNITITSEGGAATMQLQQGVAKAWANVPGGGGSFNDSFNTSSHGDTGTGDGVVHLTNNMSNTNYAVTSGLSLTYINNAYSLRIVSVGGTRATSSYVEQVGQGNSSCVFLFEDRNRMTSVNGDLA